MFSTDEIKKSWNEKVKETLDKYISIPNVSPAFDSDWKKNGYIDQAMLLLKNWAIQNSPSNANVYVQEIEGKTPLLVIDIPARNYVDDDTVLLYGHLDKQPPMSGWTEPFEPFKPVYSGDRLYGRGSADDGYAIFSSVLACKYLEDNEISHARLLIVIEASEESGSPDLPSHLNQLDLQNEVSLVVCLDSGCLDYDHLWITNSLRGLLQINVAVKVLEQGVHSGAAGGLVPSALHVFREILDRIAKPGTGEVVLPELYEPIPDFVLESANDVAKLFETKDPHAFPFSENVKPLERDLSDQLIATTYKPALEVIGVDGIPNIKDAGNVLRPQIEFALSFRLPPNVDPMIAASAVSEQLNRDTPFSAQIRVTIDSMAPGWAAPQVETWLRESLEKASSLYFGESAQYMGEGGTIPFMAMLGEKYPNAQFMITGVLGPESNAHGPNEFLDLPTAYKITGCVASVLADHALRK